MVTVQLFSAESMAVLNSIKILYHICSHNIGELQDGHLEFGLVEDVIFL